MISLHCQHQRSTSFQRDRPALNCISKWRFYVGKNWIINLDYLWQHRNPNVKPFYRSPLLIFTERENSTFSSCFFFFCYCRYQTRNLYTEMKKEKDKAMLWFNSKKNAPLSSLCSQHILHSNEKKCLMGLLYSMASESTSALFSSKKPKGLQ